MFKNFHFQFLAEKFPQSYGTKKWRVSPIYVMR